MEPWEQSDPLAASESLDAEGATGEPSPLEPQASESSEAFQALASEVRLGVLVHLLCAERAGETPQSFSELQESVETDTSAGFAYHLRQLADRFVEKNGEGYVLTPAGRRAAHAVVTGAFTREDEPRQAS